MDDVGIVVIGRNEGERLRACLASVAPLGAPVVYVDSASSDGSPDLARSLGAHVIELSTDRPLTAARGRQTGLDWLAKAHPGLAFVFFIDGDCVLQEGFLPAARAYLQANPGYAAICGRRRELRYDESMWSRVIDVDWDIPSGDVGYVGGDALFRIEALNEVGGWSTDLIAGEEPDLCFRLAASGGRWRFRRLAVEMTGHDIAMSRGGQYFKRIMRSGYAYAEVGWRDRRGTGRPWFRATLSNLFYGLVLPAVALVGGWWSLWVVAVVALVYLRLVVRMALWVRRRGHAWSVAWMYSVLNTVGKTVSAWGALRYAAGRLVGRKSRLIEYHTHAASAAGRREA